MRYHWLHRFKRLIPQIIILSTCCSLLVTLLGCEAFVRKFTRKPKKKEAREEIVLMPEVYSPSDIPVEDRYRSYFVFWQSWQDELISALSSQESHKKRISCLDEAIKNLESFKPLLYEEKQKDLDTYLGRLRSLKGEIVQDIYGTNSAKHKKKAESLKRGILRDFSYPEVKGHLR